MHCISAHLKLLGGFLVNADGGGEQGEGASVATSPCI